MKLHQPLHHAPAAHSNRIVAGDLQPLLTYEAVHIVLTDVQDVGSFFYRQSILQYLSPDALTGKPINKIIKICLVAASEQLEVSLRRRGII